MGILFFLLILTTIVAIHEFGHYIVARMCGIHVEVFSIGMGPRLFGWTDKKGTDWRVCLLPIGGYVKMLGHGGKQKITEENKAMSYGSKNVFQRSAVVLAGPCINFVSAIFFFAALMFMTGIEKHDIRVNSLVESSPAAVAGIEVGDVLVSVNDIKIEQVADISQSLLLRNFDDAEVVVLRDGAEQTFVLNIQISDDGVPRIGIYADLINTRSESVGVIESVARGTLRTGEVMKLQVKSIARLFTGDVPLSQLRSIVGIGHDVNTIVKDVSGSVDAENERRQNETQQGNTETTQVEQVSKLRPLVLNFLNLTAFLSIAIGIMNLLPILPLDGGHLTTYIYEMVARKPMPNWLMNIYGLSGMLAILSLLLFTLGNDLLRIFGG